LLGAIRCLLENIPAKDELLRCQVELNVKRNELARLQKRAKITKELFEMVDLTKQRMTTLRKRLRPCASPSLLQMATEMESILNDVIIAIHQAEPCTPSKVNRAIPQHYVARRPSISPLRIQQRRVWDHCGDDKHEMLLNISAPHDNSISIVNFGLFAKFEENQTSTPIKPKSKTIKDNQNIKPSEWKTGFRPFERINRLNERKIVGSLSHLEKDS
uniref:Lzipper-MIP1 domain-containing protein n=1 Tax=Gongylonema pulchrum TaxID=637853 RepID=A0A183ED07_9BILA